MDGIVTKISLTTHEREWRDPVYKLTAGIFKQSMGVRSWVEIGLSYRTARLHRLAELILWNRFLGSINVWKFGLFLGCSSMCGVSPSRKNVVTGQVIQVSKYCICKSENFVMLGWDIQCHPCENTCRRGMRRWQLKRVPFKKLTRWCIFC
jgi:hypothetical protein